MNAQEYFDWEIKKKSEEMFRAREITEVVHPNDFELILREGARIQYKINAIEDIADLWEIDSFEEAKEHWENLLIFNEKYPPGTPRPKTEIELIIEDLQNETCKDCGQKIFIGRKRHACTQSV